MVWIDPGKLKDGYSLYPQALQVIRGGKGGARYDNCQDFICTFKSEQKMADHVTNISICTDLI